MPQTSLSPKVFTDAVQPYTDFLTRKFSNRPLCVSDIRDRMGKQYVDLVQEGGGVHGVALAGYTYILEKMNIGFMKMAGTSAGSINTLLLNAVYTKEEAEALGVKGSYYETRSEKVLEYLANKPLTDMVDGHPMWRKLLLGMFSGTVGFGGVVKAFKAIKRRAIIAAIALLLLIASALVLVFNRGEGLVYEVAQWTAAIAAGALLLIIYFLVARIVFVRRLYRRSEHLGINPGDDFEQWIQRDILEANGIHSVTDLKSKLNNEERDFHYHYDACHDDNSIESSLLVSETEGFAMVLQKIKDPSLTIDEVFDDLSDFISAQDELFLIVGDGFPLLMNAFEQRLKAEDAGVTKELVIVSSDITHEIKVEFPGMHKMYWGNDFSISPAKYVRASMSVPFFFKPFKIEFDPRQLPVIQREWQQYIKVQQSMEPCALLVDGGMLSNFPINVFYNPSIPVPRKPTFGIKLEYEDETTPKGIKSLTGFGGKLISTMRFFYDREFIIKHDMYQKTVRSIDTGAIHWLNFNLTDEEKIELFYRGALAATLFLAKHLMSKEEVDELIEMGDRVRYNDKTFSIYHGANISFRTEDCLVENSTFEWQQYKRERMLDRVTRKDLKKTLKEGASLDTAVPASK
ncbi:MAG TPA: patatin-like phospholipase family protein [Flavisolibacter sp.]